MKPTLTPLSKRLIEKNLCVKFVPPPNNSWNVEEIEEPANKPVVNSKTIPSNFSLIEF